MEKIRLGASIMAGLILISLAISAIGYYLSYATKVTSGIVITFSLSSFFLNGLAWFGALGLLVLIFYGIGYFFEKRSSRLLKS